MSQQPRLVVIDHTAPGDGTATGELKASLLSGWSHDALLLAHTGAGPGSVIVRGTEETGHTTSSARAAVTEIEGFAPEVALFRVSVDNPILWTVAETLAFDQGVPTIVWIMDDWLQRLAVNDPVAYPEWEGRLRRLLEQAPRRLAISDAMAQAMQARFGLGFEVLANGVLPDEWPDRSSVRARPEREGRTLLRYAGGLAPDMTLEAVHSLAKAVNVVSQGRDIHLQINTHPHWMHQHGERFSGLRNVSLSWRGLDAAGYRQWVSEADINVLAYNFDEASARYIGTSLANKLPECLAAGAGLLAIGPSELNTLAYCDQLPFVYRLASPEPSVLRAMLRDIHDNPAERERRGGAGREHAFAHFDLDAGRARLEGWLRSAARSTGATPRARAAIPKPAEAFLRISLVVPNYNGGPLLRQTLRSIVHQGYPNLELIFVDGASTDESLAIAQEFRDDMAVFISEPDEGQGDALQKGFSHATGDVMGWMNSDDILMPGSLFTLNRIFRQHGEVEWLTGRKTMLLEDGTVYLVDEARPWSRARFMAGDYRYIQQESTFWRRALWDRAGGHIDSSLRLAVDLDLWLRFFETAKLYSLDTTIGGFRLRTGQRSAAQRDAYENESLMLLRRAFRQLEPGFRERRRDFLPTQFSARDRETVEREFPSIVSDDPPIIRFTGRARDFEILGSHGPASRGEPIVPRAWFDGLHAFDFHHVLGSDPSALRAMRLRVSPSGRAPIGPVQDYTEFEPATIAVAGPIMVVQNADLRVDVIVKTSDGTAVWSIPFDRDTASLHIVLTIEDDLLVLQCNGDLIASQSRPGALGLLFSGLRLGGGLRQRFWYGAVDICELQLAGPNGASSWDAFAPENWAGRSLVKRDFERLDAQPAPAPANPRPDPLSHLRGRHAGERCFVMGSGPSLNKMDLSLLEGETVISCNASFLLFDRIRWRPRYYTCVDARVLTDRGQEIGEMLQAEPDITGLLPHVVHLHDGSGTVLDSRKLVGVRPNTLFFREVFNSDQDLPYSMFSTDIDDHVVMPYTVTITMLQIAAYLGFSEIYLIGCDTSYTVADNVIQEGEKAEAGIGLLLTSTEDDDPNHFDPRYFGRGRKWHNPQVANMIMHYGYAKQVLDEIGASVFNATIGGNLEVFPRVAFDSLFDRAAARSSRPRLNDHPAPVVASIPHPTASRMPTPTSVSPSLEPALTIVAAPVEGLDDGGPGASQMMVLAGDLPAAVLARARYIVALGSLAPKSASDLSALLSRGTVRRALVAEDLARTVPDTDKVLSLDSIDGLLDPSHAPHNPPVITAILWAELMGFTRISVLGALDSGDAATTARIQDALAAVTARLDRAGVRVTVVS